MRTDQRITTAMTELLRRQGYAATGIQQLAEASGAPVGSIYHHFKGGKRAVAHRALEESGAAYLELLVLLLGRYDDPVAGIEGVFADAAETIESTGWANLCPVGTVLGEVADVEPELRAAGDRVIASWIEAGTEHYERCGLSGPDARSFVYALVAGLEGAFILARAQRSREPLLAAGRVLAGSLAALLATARPG
ncbi:TetR/AcrR family transcriptional regulator [Nocardioides panacisoli]|uniref:TetR/AcrR family transcriptional regulator n=1 Tax=Nocardioides panacisoli TaxID=627624 RepID=A0ABP7IQL8_9ACTN